MEASPTGWTRHHIKTPLGFHIQKDCLSRQNGHGSKGSTQSRLLFHQSHQKGNILPCQHHNTGNGHFPVMTGQRGQRKRVSSHLKSSFIVLPSRRSFLLFPYWRSQVFFLWFCLYCFLYKRILLGCTLCTCPGGDKCMGFTYPKMTSAGCARVATRSPWFSGRSRKRPSSEQGRPLSPGPFFPGS